MQLMRPSALSYRYNHYLITTSSIALDNIAAEVNELLQDEGQVCSSAQEAACA